MANVIDGIDAWTCPPPTVLTHSLVWGGGGIIPEFRFHSAVTVGGGTAGGRWGLWEACEDEEQRGNPAVEPDRSQMHLSLSCYPRVCLRCSDGLIHRLLLHHPGAGRQPAGQGLRG